MKIAVFSDIHGNLNALEAVLDHISSEGITELFCLGDLLNGGCGGDGIINLLVKNQVKCLMGNHDAFVLDAADSQFPPHVLELVTKLRDWTIQNVSAASLEYLSGLPQEIHYHLTDGNELYFCHATPESLWVLEPLLCESDPGVVSDAYETVSAKYIFHGHYHEGVGVRMTAGKTLVNVSSVGANTDHLANYTVIESHQGQFCMTQKRVAYDWQGELERMHDCHFPMVNG